MKQTRKSIVPDLDGSLKLKKIMKVSEENTEKYILENELTFFVL